MMKKVWAWINGSFTLQLCFWIILTTLLVFLCAFSVGLYFASENLKTEADAKANREIDFVQLFVEKELKGVSIAGENLHKALERQAIQRQFSPEDLYDFFEIFLIDNPQVQGIAIGFEPEVYPEIGEFCPYVLHLGNTMQRSDIQKKYAYRESPWYKKVKETRAPHWSDPFRESSDHHLIISTYSIPIIYEGNFIGVLAVDLSLERLSRLVNSIKPYPHASLTVMDRQFMYICHTDTNKILTSSRDDVDTSALDADKSVFTDMLNRKRGQGTYTYKDSVYRFYYCPIHDADWTIAMHCPEDDILTEVKALRKNMRRIATLGTLVLFVICIIVIRKHTKPIKQFSEAAQSIAKGNFNTKMPKILHKNELQQLSSSLDNMQHELNDYMNHLKETTEEKGRIESELRIASNIQQAMIPKIFPPYPDRDDIDVYGILVSAKAVGGDLYDFYIRDEKLFFCIGDVSGKGVPASLVMAVTRSLFRIVSAHEPMPVRIAESMNESMSDMNESMMFVTLFIGVLDLPTGKLRYCNAGHCAPLLIGSDVSMLPVKANIPSGIMSGFKYEGQECMIEPGTTIFLYTDGLTEAENKNHAQFGEQRMLEVAEANSKPHITTKALVMSMREAVHNFVQEAEQSDDLTMCAIQYKRPQQENVLQRSITLPNDVSTIPQLAEFVDSIVEACNLDMSVGMSLNLALEEAVVNVMNYAYPEGTHGDVNIEAHSNGVMLTFVISDSGTPFDPTIAREVDTDLAAEDRPIGGLGIHLVRQIMDSMNYERIDGKNILTLRKKI